MTKQAKKKKNQAKMKLNNKFNIYAMTLKIT